MRFKNIVKRNKLQSSIFTAHAETGLSFKLALFFNFRIKLKQRPQNNRSQYQQCKQKSHHIGHFFSLREPCNRTKLQAIPSFNLRLKSNSCMLLCIAIKTVF